MNLFLLSFFLAADLFVSTADILSSENNLNESSDLIIYSNLGKQPNVVKEKVLWIPEVKGWIPYSDIFLESLISKCKGNTKSETLLSCASLLNTNLVKDGYISSRVYSINNDNEQFLEIIQGKLVEVRIVSNDEILKKFIQNKTSLIRGKVLHIPTLEKVINQINNESNIAKVTGDLSTLGSDPSKTILNINVERLSKKWENELSISNQGITGSGELRSNIISKGDGILNWNDSLIFINEVTSDKNFYIGNISSSIIYEIPISNDLYLTSSVSKSNRKLIEANTPINKLSFHQINVFGQVTKEMVSKPNFKLSSHLGINLNKSESFLSGKRIGLIKGGGDNGILQTGYIDTGINLISKKKDSDFQGSLSLLQSISNLTPNDQRKSLLKDNIKQSKAKAIVNRINYNKFINNKLSYNLQFNSQIALGILPTDMTFSFGGEDGFSSLPVSIGSGDSGWFLVNDFTREILTNSKYRIKLSPFIGMGLIKKSSPKQENDYAGSGGIKVMLEKEDINFELGVVEKFLTENNSGSWNKWLLSNGIYTKLIYKF